MSIKENLDKTFLSNRKFLGKSLSVLVEEKDDDDERINFFALRLFSDFHLDKNWSRMFDERKREGG